MDFVFVAGHTQSFHQWAVTMAVAALGSSLLQAAEPTSASSLDELIPESAVNDPEAWAEQGEGQQDDDAAKSETDTVAEPPVEVSEVNEVAWPSTGDDLGVPQLLESTEVPALTSATDRPTLLRPDGTTTKFGQTLEVILPSGFAAHDEFLNRFSALSTIRALDSSDVNEAQLAARAREDEELLRRLLRIYGFYDADVLRTLSVHGDGSETPLIRFEIEPGNQFRFGVIDLGGLDQMSADQGEPRHVFSIRSGDPVLSDRIVSERENLANALNETGYAFAEIGEPSLVVDHDRDEADLSLPVEPNGKYAFGDVVSLQPEFLSGKHLASIARFAPGDTFRSSDETDLRRAILATGLVSRVQIAPRETVAPTDDAIGVVDLDVDMVPAPLRTIAAGIGFGTGEGFQLTGSWEHRNLFPPEGMLRLRGVAGTREQIAAITFRRNNFGGRDRVLAVDLSASNEDWNAYEARTASATVTYQRRSTVLFQKRFSWDVGAEFHVSQESEVKTEGSTSTQENYYTLVMPLHGQMDTSNDLLDPDHGLRIGLSLTPEFSWQGRNSTTYLKAQLDMSAYQPVGGGTKLAARARIGSIMGADLVDIAPSRRFYAGGGGSVRGYGYDTIGPVDDADEPNGGLSLMEFSLEARIDTPLMDGALSFVPFIDAGAVDPDRTPTFDEVRFGAGLGLRYDTSIGPIRLDLATPINPRPQDSRIAVYVSLGQAF